MNTINTTPQETAVTISLGKFDNVEALVNAYNNLEREFTKKSQRLKELETLLASSAEESPQVSDMPPQITEDSGVVAGGGDSNGVRRKRVELFESDNDLDENGDRPWRRKRVEWVEGSHGDDGVTTDIDNVDEASDEDADKRNTRPAARRRNADNRNNRPASSVRGDNDLDSGNRSMRSGPDGQAGGEDGGLVANATTAETQIAKAMSIGGDGNSDTAISTVDSIAAALANLSEDEVMGIIATKDSVVDKIIADYLMRVAAEDGVRVLSGRIGATPLTPPQRPRTLREAKALADKLLRG